MSQDCKNLKALFLPFPGYFMEDKVSGAKSGVHWDMMQIIVDKLDFRMEYGAARTGAPFVELVSVCRIVLF